jgi:phosphoglycolate phosphatase
MDPVTSVGTQPCQGTLRGRFQAVRGVVFDFDGTLVATRIDFAGMRQAIANLLQRWRLEPMAAGPYHYVLEMVAAGRQALQGDAAVAAAFEREAMDIIETFEMQTCPFAEPCPGAMETLTQLTEAGYRLGIITRNGRRGVAAVMSRYPLPHDVLFTREDVARVKPHPEHLLTAMRALGLQASQALMVGDHPTDMVCGQAAGTLSVGISRDSLRIAELTRAGADFLISSLPQLLSLLNGGQAGHGPAAGCGPGFDTPYKRC